jgi:uncharacterized protein YndB with AHSA1/START domain
MEALPPIEWRVHLKSPREEAFAAWTTDSGRARFWAEESCETQGGFALRFVNGEALEVGLLEASPPSRLVFRYFGGSTVTVNFAPDGQGGCDVHLREDGVPPEEHLENFAGWVSVLLALKAAVDFGVDLCAHDPSRSWDQRHVDN